MPSCPRCCVSSLPTCSSPSTAATLAWTHLIAIASGRPLDPTLATPPAWRTYVEDLLGATAPHRMTDGRTPAYRDWSAGYDPDSWLDRAIHATRMEIFPLHGIDPLP